MAVIAYGVAGLSLARDVVGGRDAARRGSFFERVVGAAVQRWLDARPGLHFLFHEVADLRNVPGVGDYAPMGLGAANIDHVVLAGDRWLMIDAKGCGRGKLAIRNRRGVLINGEEITGQPWMDDVRSYSKAGVLYRLLGKKEGWPTWVLPDETKYDDSIMGARFLAKGGTVVWVAEIEQGALNAMLPEQVRATDPADVERLRSRLSAP